MSARGNDPDSAFDAEVERALSAVARPLARAEYKRRLRERFLSVEPGASVSAQPAPLPSESLRGRLLRLGALAAAAAILLVLFAVRPRGPRWTIADPVLAGIVRVDGVSLRAEQRSPLEDALAGARFVETTEHPLRLRLEDVFVIELAEHSRIEISALDKNARSEPFALRADRGAVRVVTGPGFAGSQMRVSTSDLDLRVTGTAFAVDLLDTESGTCVCCLHGAVEVRAAAITERKSVEEGKMCIVWRDKSMKPTWAPTHDPHVGPLKDLEKYALTLWKK